MRKESFLLFQIFSVFFIVSASVLFISIGRRDYESYYIYDDSTCLVVISRCFYGREYQHIKKLCDYILIDGVYFICDENNCLVEVTMFDSLDIKSSETGSKGDIYE